MAIINFTGFDLEGESYSQANYSIQSSIVRSGVDYANGSAMQLSNEGFYGLGSIGYSVGDNSYNRPVALQLSNVYARVYYYYDGASDLSVGEYFFGVACDELQMKIGLFMIENGAFEVRDSNENVLDTVPNSTILADTWTRVELMCGTGSAARYEVRVEGVTVSQGTFNSLNALSDYVFCGTVLGTTGNYNFYYDDFTIDDANFPGAGIVRVLLATGDGTYTDWTASAGNKYDCIAKAPNGYINDFSTYIYSDTLNDSYSAAMQNRAAVDADGSLTIRSVKQFAYVSSTSPSDPIEFDLFVYNGTQKKNTNSCQMLPASVLSFENLVPYDPSTNNLWSGIDNLEAGIELLDGTGTQVTAMYVSFEASENFTGYSYQLPQGGLGVLGFGDSDSSGDLTQTGNGGLRLSGSASYSFEGEEGFSVLYEGSGRIITSGISTQRIAGVYHALGKLRLNGVGVEVPEEENICVESCVSTQFFCADEVSCVLNVCIRPYVDNGGRIPSITVCELLKTRRLSYSKIR